MWNASRNCGIASSFRAYRRRHNVERLGAFLHSCWRKMEYPWLRCPASVMAEDIMPRQYATITLAEAKRMLFAAEAKAASLGIAYNIAIVDAGGHLVAFVRQDGALIGSIDLAIDKAMTARFFDKTTSELATLAQSGRPLFGIQESNAGKIVIFGGGLPIVWEGNIVGAVGASAGTVEQDIEVADAAIAALSR
jgi:uncharacterized protein GlcG (DUF336 family)